MLKYFEKGLTRKKGDYSARDRYPPLQEVLYSEPIGLTINALERG